MSEITETPVKKLALDLKNFRTVHQKNEIQAIQAMISISPDKFWGLTESLIDDGFLPTENIIVLRAKTQRSTLVVKEGNRRVAALKLIHGIIQIEDYNAPDDILRKISQLSASWKRDNKSIPCTIFPPEDAAIVDRIVRLAHGKGEKAGRDQWNAVARARHNRDFNGQSETALDLLEKYLSTATNHSREQAERWAGDYPLTVLDEAVKKIATRLDATNGPALAKKYPKISNRIALDKIIKDIGSEIITFKILRAGSDFAIRYGLRAADKPSPNIPNATSLSPHSSGKSASDTTVDSHKNSPQPKKPVALAINDPKTVMRLLRKFSPRGHGREKVASLLEEILHLKLDRNPIAFCFLLRSAFEISAKAYCADHTASNGPSLKKSNGEDKHLVDLLRDITNHLTSNKTNREMMKTLHGAMTELARADSILSVTSMNQLVHNPRFSITPNDIASLFGKIFPLLEEMNN